MGGSFSYVGPASTSEGTTVREVERIVGAVADNTYIEDKLDLLVATLREMNLNVQVSAPDTVVNMPENQLDLKPQINIEMPEIRVPQPTVVVKSDRALIFATWALILADIALKVFFK